MLRNQLSAEKHMSRYQNTINQFCTKISVDTWKSTTVSHMINKH